MKKIIIILTAILAFGIPSSAKADSAALEGMWQRGNNAYINADYPGAVATYDSIVSSGYTSYKLYYNMANAYFRMGRTGKAVLFYNRALLLAPSNPDVQYNLSIANTYVKDDIESLPEFFLTKWVRSARMLFSSNVWAAFSIVMLACALGFALLYLLGASLRFKKTGFYFGIVSSVLFFIMLGFSLAGRHDLRESNEAVVMSSAAPVKSSPDGESKDIFILHEGTKVSIVGELGQWREIEIANGNKGWISETAIEGIR